MPVLNRKLRSAFVGLAIACATTASATTIVTPQAGGNSNDGVMFDVKTGANALTLTSISANIFGTASYEIYYKTGTLNDGITNSGGNNVSDPALWTLLGSFSNVVGIGAVFTDPGGLVAFDITDVALAANATYGLYITKTDSDGGTKSGVRFTGANPTPPLIGSTIVSDSNVSILTGRGALYKFDGISRFGRSFNGSLTYTVNAAVPEPATWGMMIVGFGLAGASLRRRGVVAATA